MKLDEIRDALKTNPQAVLDYLSAPVTRGGGSDGRSIAKAAVEELIRQRQGESAQVMRKLEEVGF